VTTTLNRKYSYSLPPCRRNIQHLSFDGTNKNAVENTRKHDISSENFIFLGEEAWTSSPDLSTKIINFFIYALQLSSSQGGRWGGECPESGEVSRGTVGKGDCPTVSPTKPSGSAVSSPGIPARLTPLGSPTVQEHA